MNFRTLGISFFFLALAAVPSQCREPQALSSTQVSAPAYPNTSDGLQNLIGDILRAAQAKDIAKETAMIRSLLLPEDSTWFIDEYGPGFGASLAAAYRRELPGLEQEIKEIYEANAQAGLMSPKTVRYGDPESVNAPIDHFLNCMNQVVPLYQTSFLGDQPMFQMTLKPGGGARVAAGDLDGYFIYANGGFRYIPSEILMKLPNERPVRIHLGMNVMQSKLINRVYPRYPPEAYTKRIGGKVVVRVDLDRGGKIQEAKVVDGNPILSQALLEAVKQWQFEPTRLDGDLVEVEVDVEMVFESH
jgi:TonB family protein